jgi:anaerobic magnesium-protoporphyrin IX monomethyl ester cyclase
VDVLLLTPIDPLAYQVEPDLGLMYLASSLRQAGIEVAIGDCKRERWDLAQLAENVRRRQPRVVGIKCFSHEVKRVGRMAEAIRQTVPETVILVGGPHPSMDPRGTLAGMPAVDYVFLGESEQNLVAFVRWVQAGGKGSPPAEVRGIAFRTEAGVEVREAVFGLDVDRLPLPAWDLMPPSLYPDEVMGVFVPAFPAAAMVYSRGCPFPCAYCGCRYVVGRQVRYRSVENMLAEIDLLERDHGIRTITFVDDNFTWDRQRALALFEALAQRPRRIALTFPNGVRVDRLDEEVLKAMERAGCYLVAMGIESGSDATLARMKKKQTVAMVRETVALIRRTTRMQVTAFFILGYPGETLDDVRETIRFASELPLHHAHFCLFIPIPGTPVYEELLAQGWTAGDPEDLIVDQSAPSLPGLPGRQLLRLHQMAYFRFYLRPWRVLNLLRQMRSPSQLRFVWRRLHKLFR